METIIIAICSTLIAITSLAWLAYRQWINRKWSALNTINVRIVAGVATPSEHRYMNKHTTWYNKQATKRGKGYKYTPSPRSRSWQHELSLFDLLKPSKQLQGKLDDLDQRTRMLERKLKQQVISRDFIEKAAKHAKVEKSLKESRESELDEPDYYSDSKFA